MSRTSSDRSPDARGNRSCVICAPDSSTAADALLIAEALRERGHGRIIHRAGDGLAALEWLRAPVATRPDLIVLDLNTPRMNGWELLSELKADERLKVIPVVVLTTSAAPQDVTNAYQRHANAYVTKPANLADFEHAVRSIDEFFLNIASPVPRS
ncbi:response regulator [Actinocrinis sp.]|uniref:response regulator n=1 Tax=Actinocrinis sp. TaxID=1920516 RepID=UPI002D40D8BF|nr:response regulator [Actinocrinis sp.]HZP51363.1 response regulator [Actinocrinis sp.]